MIREVLGQPVKQPQAVGDNQENPRVSGFQEVLEQEQDSLPRRSLTLTSTTWSLSFLRPGHSLSPKAPETQPHAQMPGSG